jgi:cyclopropane fatty-acyl-phospholipid synthase-like methyltransferase
VKKIILFLLNNIVINQFFILISKDAFIKNYINNWAKVKFNQNKSLQENVGFSHTKEIDEAVEKIHVNLKEVESKYLSSTSKILDIGCGVGLYLKDFFSKDITGTDLNEAFLQKCKELLPHCVIHKGDYLNLKLPLNSFDLIYSVSVIEYIPPSKIQLFFDKIATETKSNGLMLIQYPHALNLKDKLYSDLSYISYTTNKIDDCVNKQFNIIYHKHSFDGRKVNGIDKINHSRNNQRSFCNGMILLAQKKQ